MANHEDPRSSPTGGPMLSREVIAVELLRCALAWKPEARLLGNLRACDVAALAASVVTCCPNCGAEPWVNIDCALCTVCAELMVVVVLSEAGYPGVGHERDSRDGR